MKSVHNPDPNQEENLHFLVLIHFLLLACLVLIGCRNQTDERSGEIDTISEQQLAGLKDKVYTLCGACHGYVEPSSFPKDKWPELVKQGYRFFRESDRPDLKAFEAPPMSQVTAYYQKYAPTELKLPEPNPKVDWGGLRFTMTDVPLPDIFELARVSHIRWWLPKGAKPSLLFCDMKSGDVCQVSFNGRSYQLKRLATLQNPAHVEPCDLDGDGVMDFIVAELGSFEPADHDRGMIYWLRRQPDAELYQRIVIQRHLARVADVQPADLDGDGDLDLVVGEYGWRKTGRLLWLERIESSPGRPRFKLHVLDERHGTIHVPVVDLNGDGRLDVVALIAQEHETILAFLNEGDGQFDMQQIFGAADPSYGSSGIQVLDLDGDGDLDVLYTNGDTFDSQMIKPEHSVQWLENQGEFPFQWHLVARISGAYRALAADLDRDGDLDIVACSNTGFINRNQNGLVWFEQQPDHSFVRHDLEYSKHLHVAMDVGDFDGNGWTDIAVGHFGTRTSRAWVTIWWNEGKDKTEASIDAQRGTTGGR
ncbi:MAG: VCBS repeat-containing protein [Planctomycetes bacterium]|nr:VCBS repeat-containing protein [Planctomycetota bacterium]